MTRFFTRIAGRIAFLAGQPSAFLLALLIVAVWAACGPFLNFSETWQLVINTGTTIITFLMIFLVQNSQNRDAAALQAKLDELIRVAAGAENTFIGIEHLTEEQIEAIRRKLEQAYGVDEAHGGTHATIQRLQSRR